MSESELIPWRMTRETRRILLAALDEAAEHKRDRIEVCSDCRDGTCGLCLYRAEAAADYDRIAEIVGEAGQVTTGG